MLITPPCYLSRIYCSIPIKLLNSIFGELDGRRLARLFYFILNFEFKFLLNVRLVIFLIICDFIIHLYYFVYGLRLRFVNSVGVFQCLMNRYGDFPG